MYSIVYMFLTHSVTPRYGSVQHELERKVTTLGRSQELFVECYVPRFKIYQLRNGDDTTITGQGNTPTIQISLHAPARTFCVAIHQLYNVDQKDVRYWRADVSVDTKQGFEYPVGRLLTCGAEPFVVPDTDLDKTLADLLINPSDEFIVEIKENNQWIVDLEKISRQLREQHETSSSSTMPNGPRELAETSKTLGADNNEPLFKSGGFFGEMSNRLGIASSTPPNPSGIVAPTLQPPVNIAGRSKATLGLRKPGTLGLNNLCVILH